MSKQVICINPRNYRLTRNLEYVVRDAPGRRDYYNVINDAGRSVTYSSDLFEDVVTESTDQEVIDSLTVRVTSDNVIINFTLDGEERRVQVRKLTENTTNISCGIKQLVGVNAFSNTLVNNLNFLDDRGDLKQQIINAAYSGMLNSVEDAGVVLLSTNINDGNINVTDTALTELSATEYETYNPNSTNTIKLWVVDINEEEPDDENTE